MLTPRLPYPPDRGDKIRSFHELRYLARRHRVFCAALLEPHDDPQALHLLRCYCRDVAAVPVSRAGRRARALACVATGRPCTEGYFHSAGLVRVLAAWNRKNRFDAVLAFSGGMAPYAERVSADRRILDLVDVDSVKWRHYAQVSRGWRRMLYEREATRLCARELEWLRRFDATVVINSREAALMQRAALPGSLHVIPNGVSLPAGPTSATATEPVVGFVGMMNYLPNIDAVLWFVRSVWPAVRRKVSAARLIVVGRHPHRQIRNLDGIDGVTITGAVPDVGVYLRQFRACVAPFRIARGLQNKVLEALAAARPVVASPAGAAGIEPCPVPGLLLAEGSEPFVRHLVTLLTQPDLADRLGKAGRAFVAENYRWDDALARLDALLIGDGGVSCPQSRSRKPRLAPEVHAGVTMGYPAIKLLRAVPHRAAEVRYL